MEYSTSLADGRRVIESRRTIRDDYTLLPRSRVVQSASKVASPEDLVLDGMKKRKHSHLIV